MILNKITFCIWIWVSEKHSLNSCYEQDFSNRKHMRYNQIANVLQASNGVEITLPQIKKTEDPWIMYEDCSEGVATLKFIPRYYLMHLLYSRTVHAVRISGSLRSSLLSDTNNWSTISYDWFMQWENDVVVCLTASVRVQLLKPTSYRELYL